MTHAAVGIRCPECAGRGARPQRAAFQRTAKAPVLTYALIGANLVIFALTNTISLGFSTADINHLGHQLQITSGGIQDGQYWRLISNAFMHYGLLHIAFNMYALWILGGVLEPYVGTLRFGMIYFVSALTASLGALLVNPDVPSAGASGAIFGLMGALFVLERQRGMALLAGPIGGLLVINLIITFGVPGISIGGHLGGLAGGVLVGLILSRFGKGHIAYSPLTPLIAFAVVAVGVAAVIASLAVAG
jgi:membrane associated rhomboid family serine protease